jgi:formylglycine-generating enzyme required for sulfatase activity
MTVIGPENTERIIAILATQASLASLSLGVSGYFRKKIAQTQWPDTWKGIRIGALTNDAGFDARELVTYALKQGRIPKLGGLTALGSLLQALLEDLGGDDYDFVEMVLQKYNLLDAPKQQMEAEAVRKPDQVPLASDPLPLDKDQTKVIPEPAILQASPASDPLILRLAEWVELPLVRIPAGDFLMGSDMKKDKDTFANELQQHAVYLEEYYIGKAPVTVAQFAVFILSTNYRTTAEQEDFGWVWISSQWKKIKGADWQHPRGLDSSVLRKAQHPVTQVSWDDAIAFCRWLSEMSGQECRLPTEAEWEKAARGMDGRLHPWGNEPPHASLCNYYLNVGDTTPVGKYSPKGDSPYGCVDMAGNVWEWTSSLWGEDANQPKFRYPYRAGDGREDRDSRERRVLRGGSFPMLALGVRCAVRDQHLPFKRSPNYGFRVVVMRSGPRMAG